jgi:hypothetical protein
MEKIVVEITKLLGQHNSMEQWSSILAQLTVHAIVVIRVQLMT